MTVFTRTWDAAYEAVPADSDQISEGALRIRQTRVDVQERGVVDHSWAGDVEDGTHLKVTFTDPLGAKPPQELDNTYLYTKDVSATSELFFEDEAGNEVQLTAAGAVGAFPSTTAMVFYQDTAPTGWTIAAALDEHSVRLTKGSVAGGQAGGATGGTNNFSTQFATLAEGATPGVGNHSLTSAQNGPHTHSQTIYDTSAGAQTVVRTGSPTGNPVAWTTGSSGSGAGHSHTVDLRVKWAACIVATKD